MQRSRKTVEDKTVPTVILVDSLGYHVNNHFVGRKLTLVKQSLDFQAQRRSLGRFGTKHFAGRQMANSYLLFQNSCLRAFTAARSSGKDHMQTQSALSERHYLLFPLLTRAAFLISPSY